MNFPRLWLGLFAKKCAGRPTRILDTLLAKNKLKRKHKKPIPANLTDMDRKPEGYFSDTRDNMLKYVPKDVKTTLEFGCGFGGFSALLKKDLGMTFSLIVIIASRTPSEGSSILILTKNFKRPVLN